MISSLFYYSSLGEETLQPFYYLAFPMSGDDYSRVLEWARPINFSRFF